MKKRNKSQNPDEWNDDESCTDRHPLEFFVLKDKDAMPLMFSHLFLLRTAKDRKTQAAAKRLVRETPV